MTHHEHIEMLIDGIQGIGTGWICGTGKDIRFATYPDDVRRVTATRSLRVISVDGASANGLQSRFHEPRLVECIRMNGDLDVKLIRHAQAAIDGRRGRSPVFV